MPDASPKLSETSVKLVQDIAEAFTAIAAIPETEARRTAAQRLRDTLRQAAEGIEDTFVTPPGALKISGVAYPASVRVH